MAQHHETTGVIKNYTFTTLLSFSIMFCLFVLLSRCHGSFHPATNHHSTTHEQHQPATHH